MRTGGTNVLRCIHKSSTDGAFKHLKMAICKFRCRNREKYVYRSIVCLQALPELDQQTRVVEVHEYSQVMTTATATAVTNDSSNTSQGTQWMYSSLKDASRCNDADRVKCNHFSRGKIVLYTPPYHAVSELAMERGRKSTPLGLER